LGEKLRVEIKNLCNSSNRNVIIQQKESNMNTSINELTHYTSIQTLELILKSKKMLFNRLDRVDDAEEMDVDIQHLAYSTYVSCWTEKKDDLLFWNMYAGQKDAVGNLDKCSGVSFTMRTNPFRFYRYTINEHAALLEELYQKFSVYDFDVTKVSFLPSGKILPRHCIPYLRINNQIYVLDNATKDEWKKAIWKVLSIYELHAFNETRNGYYEYNDNPESLLEQSLGFYLTYTDTSPLVAKKVLYDKAGRIGLSQTIGSTMFVRPEDSGVHKSDTWADQKEWRYVRMFDGIALQSYWAEYMFKTTLRNKTISEITPARVFYELSNESINEMYITISPYCRAEQHEYLVNLIDEYNQKNYAKIKIGESRLKINT
jgi:hypothetical protein